MKKGDLIINPWVSPITYYGKPNPNYALIFIERKDIKCIKVLTIRGSFAYFICRKSEEPEWKVVGHVSFNIFNNIKSMIPEWSDVAEDG